MMVPSGWWSRFQGKADDVCEGLHPVLPMYMYVVGREVD